MSDRPKKQTGGCLCGAFRYELEHPVKYMVNCHCEMCRKAMGVAVNCVFLVPAQDFTILKNTSNVTYAFSEQTNTTRHFCSTCGCTTFAFDVFFPGMFIIMSGTLDEDPQIDVTCEIFISNRAPWCALRKDIPGSDGFESWQEIYSNIMNKQSQSLS